MHHSLWVHHSVLEVHCERTGVPCLQSQVHDTYVELSGKVGNSPELHPVLADVYKAAAFASADGTVAQQAAGMVQLLCGLLDPNCDRRLPISKITKIVYPWLFANAKSHMPVCPVDL